LSTEFEYDQLKQQFKMLQELHDGQKKIIARLQEENQALKQEIKDLQNSST
jgi:cell division protein FtsB